MSTRKKIKPRSYHKYIADMHKEYGKAKGHTERRRIASLVGIATFVTLFDGGESQ